MKIASVNGSTLRKHITVRGFRNMLGLLAMYDNGVYIAKSMHPIHRDYSLESDSPDLLEQVAEYTQIRYLDEKYAGLFPHVWQVWTFDNTRQQDGEYSHTVLHNASIEILREDDMYHVYIQNEEYVDGNGYGEVIDILSHMIGTHLSVLRYTIRLHTHICDPHNTSYDLTEVSEKIGTVLGVTLDPQEVVAWMISSMKTWNTTPRARLYSRKSLGITCSLPNHRGACSKQHALDELAVNVINGIESVLYCKFHPCSLGFQRRDNILMLNIERLDQVERKTLPIWQEDQKLLADNWFQDIKNALRNK